MNLYYWFCIEKQSIHFFYKIFKKTIKIRICRKKISVPLLVFLKMYYSKCFILKKTTVNIFINCVMYVLDNIFLLFNI